MLPASHSAPHLHAMAAAVLARNPSDEVARIGAEEGGLDPALAVQVAAALELVRDEVEQELRDSFLDELRSRRDLSAEEISRRALRLGCDVGEGAVVLCARLETARPRELLAGLRDQWPGALGQLIGDRAYAVLPARAGEDPLVNARTVATRLQRQATVGLSSLCMDPAELPRAVEEAELVLEVALRSGPSTAAELASTSYRLLFRVLASHPEEIRALYDDTVAAVVAYDAEYRTDLVATLEAYLGHDCNMNATAAAIYAHRHTVAYRLDRIRALTGLEPNRSEDRERLGLGLKAHRLLAPTLPR